MRLAALSLQLHLEAAKVDSVNIEEIETASAASVGDILPKCGHTASNFIHLTWCDAKYYSYMWVTAINRDILTRFNNETMMSRQTCWELKHSILEMGSTKPALELARDFLGRPTNQAAFQLWLQGRD